MPPNSKNETGLNEKLCWDLWWTEGSLERVADALADRGIVSPKTGKPVSAYGVEVAAWRYAVRHIQAAKDDFRRDAEKRKTPFDENEEEKFYIYIVRAGKRVLTPKNLEKWIVENDLEQYRKFL